MTDNGSISQTLNAGGSYTIPKGYHDGTGKVTANTLPSQTSATAAASNILSGKTAWVNGSKITGSMANKAGATVTASIVTESGTNALITIPSNGYYSTSSKISVPIETIKNEVSDLGSNFEILTQDVSRTIGGNSVNKTYTTTKKYKKIFCIAFSNGGDDSEKSSYASTNVSNDKGLTFNYIQNKQYTDTGSAYQVSGSIKIGYYENVEAGTTITISASAGFRGSASVSIIGW